MTTHKRSTTMLKHLRIKLAAIWKTPLLNGQLTTYKPRLIVYDFDGVMTDNSVLVRQDGTEHVTCNRGDGLGINIIKSLQIPQIILSTETNPVVLARAKKIGIPAIGGSNDKLQTLTDYCNEKQIELDATYFVGNDTNDLEVMQAVGFGITPSDGHIEIKAAADLMLCTRGGRGVIRELADMLADRFQ